MISSASHLIMLGVPEALAKKEVKKVYYPENIVVFRTAAGLWQADYRSDDLLFALHRASCLTEKVSYDLAKAEIDFLNREGEIYE